MSEEVKYRSQFIMAESFYDSIAEKYNSQLTNDDAKARKEIERLITQEKKEGTVLDFGGGTGLDLEWLSQKFERVIFFEPSSGMRAIAKEKHGSNPKIFFCEDQLNFEHWTVSNPPFTEKVDTVLANFAVLNSIKGLARLFDQLAHFCEKDCVVFLIVINPSFKAMTKNYSLFRALLLKYQGTSVVLNKSNKIHHSTYLHSIETIKRALGKNFLIKNELEVPFSNFVLITLRRV